MGRYDSQSSGSLLGLGITMITASDMEATPIICLTSPTAQIFFETDTAKASESQ